MEKIKKNRKSTAAQTYTEATVNYDRRDLILYFSEMAWSNDLLYQDNEKQFFGVWNGKKMGNEVNKKSKSWQLQ